MRIFRHRDIIIIALIALVAFFWMLTKKSSFGAVLVEVDGKIVMRIQKPGEYDVYRNGRRITTVVFDGKRVRVRNSTCPLKLCEKMGWIGPGGEIVCVPNHLVVRFERSSVDAMTW